MEDIYQIKVDMSRKEALRRVRAFEKTLIDTKHYKNYLIEFRKYPQDWIMDRYQSKKSYKKGIVYAHGFRQVFGKHPRGKLIGTGKTKEEAFRKAKKWIDEQNKQQKPYLTKRW